MPRLGGKNAFLGEMLRTLKSEGVRLPDGFAATADAYCAFLEADALTERIRARHKAVKRLIYSPISTAHAAGCKVGICGQAPSDYPDFAAWLVKVSIDAISLNPDSVIQVKRRVAKAEAQRASAQKESS